MAEAIAMCRRYGEILGGTLEIDVRLLEPSDEPSGAPSGEPSLS